MTLGNYTIENWGYVASCKISPPEMVKHFIDIPGRNGSIDASEALTGFPVYDDRSVEIRILAIGKTAAEFQAWYDDIYAKVHGKKLNFVNNNDTSYYYVGRWQVSEVDAPHRYAREVTIKGNCEPYALKNAITTKTIATGSLAVSSVMPTKMTVNATTEVSITRGTETSTYSVGTHRIDYPLLVGSETLTINGGTGTITYQEGKL